MIRPVELEIVVPGLGGGEFGCFGCRALMREVGLKKAARRSSGEYPEEWKEMVYILSSWVQELGRLYRHRLNIRIINSGSLLGLWKQIRHRVFKTPAFIIDRKTTYVGWDHHALQALLDKHILSSQE